MGVVGVSDQRPDHIAAFVGNDLLQIGIAVVGLGLELAAERGLGVAYEDRVVGVALETDVERLVVGDEFGAKREHEQHHEDMERPVAAPVGLEVLPAPAIDRRECEKTSLARGLGIDQRRLGRLGKRDGRSIVQFTPPASRSRCADRPMYR